MDSFDLFWGTFYFSLWKEEPICFLLEHDVRHTGKQRAGTFCPWITFNTNGTRNVERQHQEFEFCRWNMKLKPVNVERFERKSNSKTSFHHQGKTDHVVLPFICWRVQKPQPFTSSDVLRSLNQNRRPVKQADKVFTSGPVIYSSRLRLLLTVRCWEWE